MGVAPCPRHFFYMWPDIVFPMRDRFIIALQAAPLWFLATPAHPLQHVPNATGMIAHPEQVPDQISDPIERPVIFRIAVRISAALQGPHQPSQLGGRQTAGTAGWRTLTPLAFRMLRVATPPARTCESRADPVGLLGWALSAS